MSKKQKIEGLELYHDGILEYRPMIAELAKRTRLPKFVCKMVYDSETMILRELGIITNVDDVEDHIIGLKL